MTVKQGIFTNYQSVIPSSIIQQQRTKKTNWRHKNSTIKTLYVGTRILLFCRKTAIKDDVYDINKLYKPTLHSGEEEVYPATSVAIKLPIYYQWTREILARKKKIKSKTLQSSVGGTAANFMLGTWNTTSPGCAYSTTTWDSVGHMRAITTHPIAPHSDWPSFYFNAVVCDNFRNIVFKSFTLCHFIWFECAKASPLIGQSHRAPRSNTRNGLV